MELPKTITAAITAVLILENGDIFYGKGIGKLGLTTGEICFNTATTGYQEIMTDPSYSGQIINFTFPHIGNVGVNSKDYESNKIFLNGVIFRNSISEYSNYRAEKDLNSWLKENNVTGITGIDTRKLTKIIREQGALRSLIFFRDANEEFDIKALKAKLEQTENLKNKDLASIVSCSKKYSWTESLWEENSYKANIEKKYKIIAFDFGAKLNILRHLAELGCEVEVVPSNISFEDLMALKPNGIFLSNGPGDPEATSKFSNQILKKLIEINMPIFGICLGHQLIANAIGAKTQKMFQGHRGANHPVKNLITGKIEITSQNHGFEVISDSLPADAEVTHKSLFDGCVEGLRLKSKPVFSVQYHPESSPGPHDSHYLFHEFVELIKANCKQGLKENA